VDNDAHSTEDRCRREKETILKTHTPEPIAPELARTLDDIVAAAHRELRKK
jgi:trimethylamine:corrinoid methyltransferase-like protein